MSLSVGSWHCVARAHRVELADAITVTINPTCCDAAALSMSKKISAQGNNYSGKFSKVSCQWSMLRCPHWSIRVPIQLFNLLRTDKMEREINNFKVVYPLQEDFIHWFPTQKLKSLTSQVFSSAPNNESGHPTWSYWWLSQCWIQYCTKTPCDPAKNQCKY